MGEDEGRGEIQKTEPQTEMLTELGNSQHPSCQANIDAEVGFEDVA